MVKDVVHNTWQTKVSFKNPAILIYGIVFLNDRILIVEKVQVLAF